ncbi:hypothetical protein F7734_46015 [Scytonema sp. UIC 10036]|uniref:hypothetical protein n=1 Tax=Scytonema sp. UIC 10036 TaxID=2304196 RepID=UPI0012DA1195|nr:hypothetical protein [Scytonema sp. UIC 10036]MUG99261.1 hypothetical protein [Scytonema sp. UIC 10036]
MIPAINDISAYCIALSRFSLPLVKIQEATQALLEASSDLSLIQQSIGKFEFNRELKRFQQNPKDVKEYVELAQSYSECDPEEISALGILSLKKLTRPSLTPVREALENLTDITPTKIENLIKTLCKRERKPTQLRDTIWGEGGIFFNTGDIYDHPEAGIALERMAKSEGKTPQTIAAQSIELRQEIVKVIETQSLVTEISLQASVVEENDSSLSVTLNTSFPKVNFQGQEFLLLDATKKWILELDRPMSEASLRQPPYASDESVERQRTLQKIAQYQADLFLEQNPPTTPLSELSSVELTAVEVLLEAATGQVDWNKIKTAIANINPDRKEKVWFALSKDQRARALKAFPPHYILLTQAVKKNLIYEFQEDKSGRAIQLRIRNTVPSMFDELVSIDNLESFLKTLSSKERSASSGSSH